MPIRNGLQILNLAGNDLTVAKNARSIMDQALNQLVRLVDDLLDVSRITTGKLKLRMERVELAAVVQSTVDPGTRDQLLWADLDDSPAY